MCRQYFHVSCAQVDDANCHISGDVSHLEFSGGWTSLRAKWQRFWTVFRPLPSAHQEWAAEEKEEELLAAPASLQVSNKNGKLVCSVFMWFRSREAAIRAEEETGGVEGGETARQRIHRKLRSCQLRWRQSREEGEEGWVPTQKMPRWHRKFKKKNIFLNLWVKTCRRQTKYHKNHSFLPFLGYCWHRARQWEDFCGETRCTDGTRELLTKKRTIRGWSPI